MKKYLWALAPLALLALIFYVNHMLWLLSYPNDAAVLGGVFMFCVLILIVLFTITKIKNKK